VGIAQADPRTGQWLRVNKKMCEITGYSASELVQLRVPDITHPADRQLDREAFERVVRGETPDYRMEKRYIRKDGSLAWVNVNMTIIRDAAGQPTRTVAAIEDITTRKELEAQMERLHTEHAAVLDSLGEGVHWVDVDGRIKYENPAAVKMLGYEASDLLGKPAHATMHHTRADGAAYPQSECPIYATLRDGLVRRVTDEVFWRKDGSSFPVEYICTPVCGQNERSGGSVVIFTDITERKRAQGELENVHKQLLEASRRGGMAEIATNVLHNVGNVLNSVNISTGLIVQSVKKSKASSLARVVVLLQEHAHDLGEFITNDSRGKHVPAHLAQLAEHLQADQAAIVSELDSLRRNVEHIKEIVIMQQSYAKVGGVKEMINVADLVEDSLRINEGAFNRHCVEVIREFETVPPMNIEKHKILQILVNLLRNAKHACQDSDRADKRLTVRVANGDGRIRISVIDNGVGIPPENLTRIFNHGFTTRKDGHGFGLHSGALAAKEMGGSLTVHSDGPGRGAAFMLELPGPSRDYPHE
jgi:PAS domain S-box-containing protein